MEMSVTGVRISVRSICLIHIIVSVISFHHCGVVYVCQVPFTALIPSGYAYVVVFIGGCHIVFELFVKALASCGCCEHIRVGITAVTVDVRADIVRGIARQAGNRGAEIFIGIHYVIFDSWVLGIDTVAKAFLDYLIDIAGDR